MPFVFPLGEEGNQSMMRFHREALQIARIGAPRDHQKLGVPGHVFRLIIKPTRTSNGVEMQRVLSYKRVVFEALFVEINDVLHFVFCCREEEGSKFLLGVDDGIWHGTDDLEDVLPCLCRFVDIDMR